MDAKTFIKLCACILVIFASIQVIFNLHEEKIDMRTGFSFILSNPPRIIKKINIVDRSFFGSNIPTKTNNNNNNNNTNVNDKTKKSITSTLTPIDNISTPHDTNDTSADIKNNKKEEIKSLSGTFFSSGFGLKPLAAKNGDKEWIDNGGVIYRKIKKNNSETEEKYRAPRLVDYEPFVPFNETMFFTGSIPGSQIPQSKLNTAGSLYKKKIIIWYTTGRHTDPIDKPEPLRFCPDFPCLMTTNKAYFKESSLAVFNGQLLQKQPPRRTSPNQIFMFHNKEPATINYFRGAKFHKPQWRDMFNWTMTYRSDSTFPSYYGIVRKHPNPPEKNYDRIMSQKNGTVAWMVSHCRAPSGRDKYVNELKKYVDVDIYGKCGPLKCPRNSDEKCNVDIAKKYKFYLAFENTLCPEYVSEKFFRFMSLDIVTVSRAMKGSLDAHAPPGTYIDTNDFASPKDLGTFLTKLAHNDDEYIKILREKDKYIYLFEDHVTRHKDGSVKYVHYFYEAVPFCQACQRLWNLKENAQERIFGVQKWFHKTLCVDPHDLKF